MSVVRFQRVLVATDFSEEAKIAVERAGPCLDPSAKVRFVHVLPPMGEAAADGPEAVTQRIRSDRHRIAEEELKEFAKGVDLRDAPRRIRSGSVAAEIQAEAVSFDADLVVMGACRHGPTEHLYLGSHARALLWRNASNASVFVGRKPAAPKDRTLRIAVGTDFGQCAQAAAERAQSFVDWRVSEVHLVHAIDTGFWMGEPSTGSSPTKTGDGWTMQRKAVAERLAAENQRALQGRAREHVLIGHPAQTVGDFVRDNRIDLLIVGTSGRRQEGPVILGSVAADLAEKAGASVLVVRK